MSEWAQRLVSRYSPVLGGKVTFDSLHQSAATGGDPVRADRRQKRGAITEALFQGRWSQAARRSRRIALSAVFKLLNIKEQVEAALKQP
jgi:hypothetical protein